jgi:23S rRNA (cytidine1920-2'-O)/16S rRNA (cytidine1409-2'-O)-methyltransferase
MRLDKALLERGLVPSRARAQAAISEGAVSVDGAVITKPSQKVVPQAVITIDDAALHYVSRAALKLKHALDAFGLSPEGASCLDVGSSTGGFTQVLLAHGAAHVTALDVGRDQLHPSLRDHPNVTSMEAVNAKDLNPASMPRFNWIVSDVSFISLAKALPQPLKCAASGATLVCLVKPQFEVGPAQVGKGGIVKDPKAREAALSDVLAFLDGQNWEVNHQDLSPIIGSNGNQEYLVAARLRPPAAP